MPGEDAEKPKIIQISSALSLIFTDKEVERRGGCEYTQQKWNEVVYWEERSKLPSSSSSDDRKRLSSIRSQLEREKEVSRKRKKITSFTVNF